MWKRHRLQQANLENNGGGGGDGGQAAAAAAAAAAGAAANQPWFPEAHKSLVETKGFKSVEDVFNWGINAEKLIGLDRAGRTVVLPKDEADVEGRKAYYAKIGVPESADKYELPLPEGDDGSFS
ncbi:MAG: hypothetical protein ABW110_13365, partial [Steroidobacteraceae bacterium]